MTRAHLHMAFFIAISFIGISAAGKCGNHIVGFVSGNQYTYTGNKFQMAGMYCDNSNEKFADGTYWLTENRFKGKTGFIAKLGSSGPWKGIKLRNTHNGFNKDRSTKKFSLYLGKDPNGPWTLILDHYTLTDSRQQDPPPLQNITFPSDSETGIYLKFDVNDYYGPGAGLQYLNMIAGPIGPSGSSVAGTEAVFGVHFGKTPNNDRIQDSTLVQHNIRATHLVISVDIEGTILIFMIAMVSLLVALLVGVCCHVCQCSPASLLKRREQREMNQMFKRYIQLQEEIFTKEKVSNIFALEYKMEKGVGGLGAIATTATTATTPPADLARGGQE